MSMKTRTKRLSDTEELKDFIDYAVDTEGNVWSLKYGKTRKLRPGWKKRGYDYKNVLLSDRYGNKRSFLIHRLVAITFIPIDDITLDINHKNGNKSDNRLENLEWKSDKVKKEKEFNGYVVDDFISDKIKQVYKASIVKGLPVPSENDFFNQMIGNALDSHIMQYGLRKVM